MEYSRKLSEINKLKRRNRIIAAREKGTHTKDEWILIRDFFDCCVRCGTTEYYLCKDHIMPIYQGGSDGIENIQPLCSRCNGSKGPESVDHRTKHNSEWVEKFEALVGRKLCLDSDNNPWLGDNNSWLCGAVQ